MIHPCACQILGPKPTIAPCGSDDGNVEKSYKNKASLHMVSKETDLRAWRRSCHLTCSPSVPDLRRLRPNEGDLRGAVQSLQAGRAVSRGVLHPGQRGQRKDLRLERSTSERIGGLLGLSESKAAVTFLSVCLQTGPKANKQERKEAMATGEKFIKDKNYSKNTQVGAAASRERIQEPSITGGRDPSSSADPGVACWRGDDSLQAVLL